MYIRVLKTNKYILYYLLGTSISNLGNVMTGLAFLFLTIEMTDSTIYTTGIVISQVLPYLLFGLVGGVLADWVPKKKWMIIIELLRAPLLVTLVLFHYLNILNYYHLFIVSFTIHLFGCVFNPTHRSILPSITADNERPVVNSLYDTVTRGMMVLGPIISIFFMNTIGVIHFFTLDALTYFLSALFIYLIPLEGSRIIKLKDKKINDVFVSLLEFIRWIKNHTTILSLFIVTGFIVFFNTWVWQVGLLLMVNEIFSNGEKWYSLLLSWYGAIVIGVNLITPFIIKRLNIKLYLLGSVIWGLGILVLGWAYQIPIFFIGIILAGIGLPVSGLSRVYLLQKHLPEDKLGRGFSFNAVLLYFSNFLSLILFGVLSNFLSNHTLFIICGLFMVIISLVYLVIIFRKELGVTLYNFLNKRL